VEIKIFDKGSESRFGYDYPARLCAKSNFRFFQHNRLPWNIILRIGAYKIDNFQDFLGFELKNPYNRSLIPRHNLTFPTPAT